MFKASVQALSDWIDGTYILDINAIMRLKPGAEPQRISTAACVQQGHWFSVSLTITSAANDWEERRAGHLTIAAGSTETPLDRGYTFQEINIEGRECRFGSHRWYFICPLNRRRCQKLY